MELFIILELTKDEEIFNCDKDLNRIGGYDESWATYYLLTADDVESIKNKLGNRVVTLQDEYEELKKGKYHILSADEVIGQYEEGNAWDEEMERWNDCYGNGEFLEAMDEKYDGDYSEEELNNLIKKAAQYYDERNYHAAIDILLKYMDYGELTTYGYFVLTHCLMSANQYDDAIKY